MNWSFALLGFLAVFVPSSFGQGHINLDIFGTAKPALRCLECSGVSSEAECQEKGKVRQCRFNEDACEIELRHHEGWGGGLKIYKHCKQSKACDDNYVQNPRNAWSPSQCNPETFNSVCRCCCYEDMCNVAQENCFGQPGCGRLPVIHAGTISCTDGRNFGSRCTITCNANKEMVGSTTSYCRSDGSWSNPLPNCLDIHCPPRVNLANGWYTCTNSVFSGSRCTANCRPGFTLVGPKHASCLPTGQWNIFYEPKCQGRQCPPRGKVVGGTVECSDGDNIQSRCKVTCNEGRRAVESHMAVVASYCQDNAQWSHALPKCELVQCPARGKIVNGAVSCTNGVEVYSACQAVCDEGYGLVGAPDSICEVNGQWSDPLPRCEPIKCPKRGTVRSGKVTCTRNNYAGSICTVTCNSGTEVIGFDVSECLPDGTWSSPLPVCRRVECPPRGEVENGIVQCSNKQFVGSSCSVRCNFGARLFGLDKSTCLPNGEWSEPLPTCEKIGCPDLDFSLQPGSMSCTNGFEYPSTCSFRCDAGYRRFGAPRINCISQGRWNTRMPECREVTCGPRGRIVNGGVFCTDGSNVASECQASCNEGFELVGQAFSSCLPSGRWSNRLPRCSPIKCPLRSRLEGGSITCTNDNVYRSVCTATCRPGYIRDGDVISECMDDGSWDIPLPRCQRTPCQDQGELEHGSISCTDDTNVASVCSFQCEDEGYVLFPRDRFRNQCRPNQQWNVPKPCCTRPCPPYAVMDIVIVLDSSSSIGDGNWISLTNFVRGIIRTFIVAPDAANFAIFRYNRRVDASTQIFLNSYPGDIDGLVEAFGQIPYDGSGTFTGNGLRHALEVSLSPANGNRPGVKDVVFVITDGKAGDDVKTPADALRAAGATVLALGIEPPRGALDLNQLNEIAGSSRNVVIAAGGFAGLDTTFALKLSNTICGDPCE